MRRGEVWDVDFPAPASRRPAVLLTRDVILDRVSNVTVAPVTSKIRGIPTEVQIDERAGLDSLSVVSCDNPTHGADAAVRPSSWRRGPGNGAADRSDGSSGP